MSAGRRLARAGFTLTRDYPAPVERVWHAFADEQDKLAWWGAPDAMTEQRKLAACLVMSAVGLVLTLDNWRITHVTKSSRASGKGKAARPVQTR